MALHSCLRNFCSNATHTGKIYNIFVEGNIASGKTSFLKFFTEYPKVKIFAEPVDRWRNVKGHNTLDLMYKDPGRHGLTFQTCKMPEVEYVILTEWFDWIVSKFDLHADLIVYLRTSPEVVYERLLERSRNEEKKIPLEYLQTLHELHENWLMKKQFPLPGKVLVIDANDDESVMKEKYANLADELFTKRLHIGNKDVLDGNEKPSTKRSRLR